MDGTTATPLAAGQVARPHGAIRRRAQKDPKPMSARAAGAVGSSSTMMRLYSDDSPGIKVDPMVVLVLSLSFIGSVLALHIIGKFTKGWLS